MRRSDLTLRNLPQVYSLRKRLDHLIKAKFPGICLWLGGCYWWLLYGTEVLPSLLENKEDPRTDMRIPVLTFRTKLMLVLMIGLGLGIGILSGLDDGLPLIPPPAFFVPAGTCGAGSAPSLVLSPDRGGGGGTGDPEAPKRRDNWPRAA